MLRYSDDRIEERESSGRQYKEEDVEVEYFPEQYIPPHARRRPAQPATGDPGKDINNESRPEPEQLNSNRTQDPWWRTATFWKRFSVFLSLGLSVASLIVGAIASLSPAGRDHLRALTVVGLVINAVSVSLSAATSLDWKAQSTHDQEFAARMCKVAHVHVGDEVMITSPELIARLEMKRLSGLTAGRGQGWEDA